MTEEDVIDENVLKQYNIIIDKIKDANLFGRPINMNRTEEIVLATYWLGRFDYPKHKMEDYFDENKS